MSDIDMIKKRLDKTYALTTEDVARRKALEDIIIQRDSLFEQENSYISKINELRELYLRIKDFEFEGKSAPADMYYDFKDLLTQSEFAQETIELKRNQILNNFETVTSKGFVRYFSEKGRNVVFSNENLQKIIQRTVVRQNQLKMDIRDAPGQLMDDSHIEEMMKKVGRTKLLPQGPL